MFDLFGRKKKQEHQQLLDELHEKGITLNEYRSASFGLSIEDIIRNFMESCGWKIQDFPDFLQLINITLPVELYNYACSDDRVKFVETSGRSGDLRLVSAYKNEAENYEVTPEIHLHAQQNWLEQIEHYTINQNSGNSEKQAIRC